MSQAHTYPLLNMHFTIEFLENDLREDYRFQSVEGIHAKLIKDEGQKDPQAVYENLILKRAFEPDSKLIEWCMNAINNKRFKQEDLVVKLLDSNHKFLCGWFIKNAIPVGWCIEELHAQDTKVLIERIELKYAYFNALNSKGDIIAPKKK